MNNVEIEEHVRTEFGYILKNTEHKHIIKNLQKDENILNYNKIKYGRIIKYSENLIDLIEVGDYVNGEHIDFITNKNHFLIRDNINLLDKYNKITSIVTKERFEEIEYKVKG